MLEEHVQQQMLKSQTLQMMQFIGGKALIIQLDFASYQSVIGIKPVGRYLHQTLMKSSENSYSPEQLPQSQ